MKRIPRILVAIENSREYGRGLLEGISKYARVHGPWMFVTRPEYYHGGSHIGEPASQNANASGDDAFTANTRRNNGRSTSRGQGRRKPSMGTGLL